MSTKQLDDLVAKVGLLGQRLETLSSTVSTTAAGLAGREGELASIRKQLDAAPAAGSAPDPAMTQRVGDLATDVTTSKEQLSGLSLELAAVRALVRNAPPSHNEPSDEIREMLATLRSKVEELAGFRSAVTEEQLEQRLAETGERLQGVAERIDSLAATVESAISSLTGKEHELAALHRHFTESSTRIESIVDDIREALSVFPDPGSASVDELAARWTVSSSGSRASRRRHARRPTPTSGRRASWPTGSR